MYIAYLDGIPVASNFLIYDRNVVGLYKITTVPGYEKRGIGSAITLMPLFDAMDRDYRIAVLQSSEMGFKVYERLGFRGDSQINGYVYKWAENVKTL